MASGDTLFRKIAAHLGDDFDSVTEPDAGAEAFEAYRRLDKNIRDGLRGDYIDYSKLLEQCRKNRHASVA